MAILPFLAKWAVPAAKVIAPWAAQAGMGWIADRFQRNQRMELAKYEFKRNKEMWELNNQYNSPLSQMNRYREAGLNPALMYGQGTPGNSQSSPKFEAPQYDSKLNFPNPLETIGQTQNIQLQKQQLQNLKSTNDLIQAQSGKALADSVVAGKRAGLLDHETTIKSAQAKYAETLAKTQSDAAGVNLENLRKQGQILEFERQIKQKEAEWRANGMTSNDNVILRQWIEFYDEHDLGNANLFGSPLKRLGEWLRTPPPWMNPEMREEIERRRTGTIRNQRD